MCSRPDCPHPKNEGDYFVEKIIGRRWIIGDPGQDFTMGMYDLHPPEVLASSKGRFIWLIKWIEYVPSFYNLGSSVRLTRFFLAVGITSRRRGKRKRRVTDSIFPDSRRARRRRALGRH